jgi:outer membrane lipoprotein SlyB
MRKSAILLVALVVALGLAPGCSRRRSDQDIATEIKAKLYSAPELKATSVDVVAKDGEVTLTGEVPSDAARYAAFKIATDTPGVTKVNDQMTVKVAEAALPPPQPAPAPAPARKLTKRSTPKPSVQEETPPPPAAPAQPAAAPAPPPPPPPPPQPKTVEIPANTTITIRMIDSVDSSINHTGEVFRASLDSPLVVDNEVVVPAGQDVFVKLVQVSSAGRMTGRSELGLELVRMQFQGKSYTLVSNEYQQAGPSRGKRTAETIGAGAAIGAAIGAIAGGGKGAAIGAGVGAGAGTGVQIATKGKQVKIPSETKLDFRLEQPVEVTYFPEKNRARR